MPTHKPLPKRLASTMPLSVACVYTVESYFTIDKPLSVASEIPFGISMIATVLKEAGHPVELLVLTPDTPLMETLKGFIERLRPRLFCMTAVSTRFQFVCKTAEIIKMLDSTIFIALGGAHASLNPDDAIACPCIDAICVGEGDTAVVELCSQVQEGRYPTGIHNFWIKQPGTDNIEKNLPAAFFNDQDSLPYIDRALWRPWINQPETDQSVLVGRGCPFRCSYCSNHMLRRLAPGPYVRFRSPENVVGEIELITQNPLVTNIYLEVETVGANIGYALQLCEALSQLNDRRNIPIKFKINFTITKNLIHDKIIDQLFNAFKRANIVTINIGIESGSERIRNEVLRRPNYSNIDILTFCSLAKKYGIKINIYIMIGIPTETVADFKQTIKIAQLCEPNHVILSIFYPYPGTDIYQFAKDNKLFDDSSNSCITERRQSYLNLPGFSRRRILYEYIMFNFNVYRGKWSFLKRIIYGIKMAMGVNLKTEHIYYYLSRNTKIGQIAFRKFKRKF